MATATSAVASSVAPPPASAAPPNGRPQLRSSTSSSAAAANRRSTQSPIDTGPQRRNSSHKAWQTNQSQQKFAGSSMPTTAISSPTPSQAAAMRTRTPNSGNAGESDTHDRHMHDRTIYALAHLMHRQVIATVRSGARYTGILFGVDTRNHELGVSLKWVKLLSSSIGDEDKEKAKEGEYINGGGNEKAMVIEPKDLVDVSASAVLLGESEAASSTQQNGGAGTFKTDADIASNATVRERELHRWQPDESSDTGLGLDDPNISNATGWNQFEANERLFGIKSDFDETIYTTNIDRSHPLFQQREARAVKIAADIEGQVTPGISAHMAEERGLPLPDDSGMDEEDKYSGVQRTAPKPTLNKYTPPARRAPTAHPTVPGAPHDPAIIASQLVRPEGLQQKQHAPPASQQPPPIVPQSTTINKPDERSDNKGKERPVLPPEVIVPVRGLSSVVTKPLEAPQIEKEISMTFKNFVSTEKERVKKKRADIVHRDRESKLRELKKFSESFTLKTEVPQDLVPILAKDKARQAEIIEKAKLGASRAAAAAAAAASCNSTPASVPSSQSASTATPGVLKQGGKVLPPDSFAAKDPERFQRETKALLQNFPRLNQPSHALTQSIRRVNQDRNVPIRAPVPLPEQSRPQFPPTGPAATNNIPAPQGAAAPSSTTSAPHPGVPKRLNVNARPFDPNAAAFTPIAGASTTATPSPTTSAHVPTVSRAPSPSIFFGSKRLKAADQRPRLSNYFNPFVRMKKHPKPVAADAPQKRVYKNANDYIEKPWTTTPTWPTPDVNKDKSYVQIFARIELDAGAMQSPQPPHMIPPQPHHQQLPPHMPHLTHPPHAPHGPHHNPMQQHLNIPPHYEPDPHLRQMSSPPSVMPSPSLHNATVAPYQQSPVTHHSQLTMYPSGQPAVAQYGVPGAPGGPQFGFYGNGFRGAGSASPMMMHAPQGPVPYPGGQMAGQFVQPQMYSPQQPQAYLNNGPPPPTSQGYPSPGRPTAPMMMAQGSSQGNPGSGQLMPYGMQPGQSGPVYGPQVQQQHSEFLPPAQNWLPQRSQSTIPFSSTVSPPRTRHELVSVQSSAVVTSGTPMLSPASAAFASPTLAPVQGYSSHPLQRSQTANKALDVGDGSRGNGRGRGSKSHYANNGRGGRANMNPSSQSPRRAQDPQYVDSFSNEGAIGTVGMMRGQPPPHQAAPPPPFYHGPQLGHYPPGNRANAHGGPQPHPSGQHTMPIPPQQGPSQQAPPPQSAPAAEVSEETK